MKRLILQCLALVGLLIIAPSLHADDSQPAAAPALDEHVDHWLDELQTRSRKVTTLHADFIFDREQGLIGDAQRHLGELWYEAGPPAKFAAYRTAHIVDRRSTPIDKAYIFDGRWLVERDGDEKIFIKRQVVPPDAPPAELDPLGTGRGPFVLPINLDKAALLKRFTVAMIDAAEDDPPNTTHLRLTPLPDQRADFTYIDLWHDKETLLPVKARTVDQDSESSQTVTLRNIREGEPIDPAKLSTEEPTQRGWRVQIKPYE